MILKIKSLLTKAYSPSCWGVLPGQSNPTGVREEALRPIPEAVPSRCRRPARLAGCGHPAPYGCAQKGSAGGIILTFASRNRRSEEDEEEEQRGPGQRRAVSSLPRAALGGGRGGLTVAQGSHGRGVPGAAALPAALLAMSSLAATTF